MKKLALILIFLQATILYAAKPLPVNPADFTITVHVTTSRFSISYKDWWGQQLDTLIDGQHIELIAIGQRGVLAPGDYKARLVTADRIPKHPNGYDIFRIYRLLLPDGTTRDYDLITLGPMADGSQPQAPASTTHP